MQSLYPLRFQPLFRRYLWGGRRLGSMLGKQIGPGDDYAESWEIVDHGEDQSRVAHGALSGVSLGELIATRRKEMLGETASPAALAGSGFPLLFKFLDAQKTLSVQVHPNDEQGARLARPDLGKTEAWVVLHADPGSVIYAGLKRGFDRAALAREISRGTVELCLHRFEPHVGDCVFVPAGTVHALGAGLVIAEIQQASDTTFRLFDWNRVGADGRSRPLHIEESLSVIDFAAGPVSAQIPRPTASAHIERLVACDKFVLDRWNFSSLQMIGGDGKPHLVALLSGSMEVAGDAAGQVARKGDVLLFPACLSALRLNPLESVQLLEISLP